MNNSHRQQRLMSRKLLLLGALPAIVMFIVLMVFFTSVRLEDARRDLSDSSQMLADSLAPALEYAVVSGNTLALDQILSQSLRRSKADWIRVSDVMGDQLGFVLDSTWTQLNLVLDPALERNPYCRPDPPAVCGSAP